MDKKTELAISLGQTIYNNTIDSLTKQRDDAHEALHYLMRQLDATTESPDARAWLKEWLQERGLYLEDV